MRERKLQSCVGWLRKRTHFGVVLCRCRLEMGGLCSSSTLGGATLSLFLVGVGILVYCTQSLMSGIVSARQSCCAISNNAF